MQYSLEEMSAWTPDEALTKIKGHLPAGWDFKYWSDGNWLHASLTDDEGVSKWRDQHGDPKLLFLNLLGWLLLRGQHAEHPAWQRRAGEVNPNERAAPQPTTHSEPEPEDLDPSEVAKFHKNHEE